jgi:WD40-like Beta Propeller Repeat
MLRRALMLAVAASFTACASDDVPVLEPACDDACDDIEAVDAAAVDRPVTPTFDVPRTMMSSTDITSITLEPANPTLDVVPGMAATLTFQVVGRQRDGRTRDVTQYRRFTLDNTALGALNPDTGTFTAAGLGGVGRVRVALVDGSTLTAETNLTLRARSTTLTGVTDADRVVFEMLRPTGVAAEVPTIDYPLARAVLPQNVYPPLFQWTPRHTVRPDDVYRVRLSRPHAVIETYVRANTPGFKHAWRPPADAWRAVAQSDLTAPIILTVAVISNGTLRESEARVFSAVDAVIAGSVYYWSPSASRLRRIDVGEARRVDFLPNPGDTCIGCHSVSRDGQHLAGFLEGSGEALALYDLTRDLTARPAPVDARLPAPVRRCTSYNADGTRLVAGDCGANPSSMPFTLLDGRTGMAVTAMGSPGNGFDPEWSPDGQAIAYTNRSDALAVTAALGADRFGATTVLHTPLMTDATMRVDWHPTWTPDSRWLAFQRGVNRRTAMGRGSLWLVARDGGAPLRLDNANNGAMGEDSFRPQFSPFNSGGYFWLLFTTSRPYGNMPAGVRGQKQIWVTAVRNRPTAGADPSEVPYYLDGQETATALSPYWTPAPCRPNGNACSTGGDCCSGTCDPDGAGRNTCVTPRTTCVARGGRCGGDSDCCTGLTCTNALCDLPPPQ